jgi:hypothetical protein
MAMGTRKNRDRQEPWWYRGELPGRQGQPNDSEAEITRIKDGRTVAYKAEEAVDMQTAGIVAVTTHGGGGSDAGENSGRRIPGSSRGR